MNNPLIIGDAEFWRGGLQMNWTQCQRWKGFAIRMARRGWPSLTKARREKIEGRVIDFFDCRILAGGNEKGGTWRIVHDWDGMDGEYLCDQMWDFFDDILANKQGPDGTYTTKFHNQITCCIRAGFDCAVKPSGGVLGFKIGDLKRMYPEGLPYWITSEYDGLESAKNEEPIWL